MTVTELGSLTFLTDRFSRLAAPRHTVRRRLAPVRPGNAGGAREDRTGAAERGKLILPQRRRPQVQRVLDGRRRSQLKGLRVTAGTAILMDEVQERGIAAGFVAWCRTETASPHFISGSARPSGGS